jgi:hypothetical protein
MQLLWVRPNGVLVAAAIHWSTSLWARAWAEVCWFMASLFTVHYTQR